MRLASPRPTGSVRVAGTVSYDLTRPDVSPSLSTTRGPAGTNADSGPLSLSTGGGSIQGTALSAPDITVTTGQGYGEWGGDVNLMLTTVPKSLPVNSGGGNVTIELPPGAARYHLQLDGGCGPGGGSDSAVPSSAGSAATSWCPDVSSSVPDDPSSPNVIVVSSGGGQITIT